MTEQTTEATDQAQQPPEGSDQATDQPKTFDAEYVANLRKEAAKYRTEAKANSEAAKKLAEIEEATKTEAQRTAERLRAAENAAAEAQQATNRFRIASRFNMTEEQAEVLLTGTTEEAMIRQGEMFSTHKAEVAAAEQKAADDLKKQGNRVPREGTTLTAPENDARETARRLFGSN